MPSETFNFLFYNALGKKKEINQIIYPHKVYFFYISERQEKKKKPNGREKMFWKNFLNDSTLMNICICKVSNSEIL